jgi:hypothetical protein
MKAEQTQGGEPFVERKYEHLPMGRVSQQNPT